MRHTGEKRKEARELYVRAKIRNFTHLERITGVTRLTLRDWCKEEKWDKMSSQMDIDPQAILKIYLRIEAKLLGEIEALELSGKVPTDSTLKRQVLYRKLARDIDAQFDIAGTILRYAEWMIDFTSGLPDFEGKTEFVKQLSDHLPKFIDYVIHGKSH